MKNIKIIFADYAVVAFSSLLFISTILVGSFFANNIAHASNTAAGVGLVAAATPTEQIGFSCEGLDEAQCLKKNPIVVWLNWGLTVLSAIVGVGAIIMTIVAGLQYSASRDNPQGVQAAKQKIANVVIGLAAYVFLWAFLNWLIPGGPF